MSCYLLNFPRPVGVEPKIYLKRPKIEPRDFISDDGEMFTDPFSIPEVLEFKNIEAAMKYLINFNSSDEYLAVISVQQS